MATSPRSVLTTATTPPRACLAAKTPETSGSIRLLALQRPPRCARPPRPPLPYMAAPAPSPLLRAWPRWRPLPSCRAAAAPSPACSATAASSVVHGRASPLVRARPRRLIPPPCMAAVASPAVLRGDGFFVPSFFRRGAGRCCFPEGFTQRCVVEKRILGTGQK
jgi:hypothetical protein